MKKYLIASTLIMSLSFLTYQAQAKDPNVKAYCSDQWQEAHRGWTSVSSKHGVTIMNKTNIPLVYDVYFDNWIQYPKQREMPLDYSEPPFTPNAHQEHHFTLQPGQTLNFGEVSIEKMAGFNQRGKYKTQSTTIIKYNGSMLDMCMHYNTIDII